MLGEGARVPDAGRDAGLQKSAAYDYFHHAAAVIAAEAPELRDVLQRARDEGWSHLTLDGTLIETDRLREKNDNGYDAWYSGKHKKHGGNLQVLTDPHGDPVWGGPPPPPVWVSPVTPGSTHDITAARRHVFPALNHAAATWLPVLCDQGYRGADIGYIVPAGRRDTTLAGRQRSHILAAVRSIGERANATLKGRWRLLQRVRFDPRRITVLARAALTLTLLEQQLTK